MFLEEIAKKQIYTEGKNKLKKFLKIKVIKHT